VPALRGEVTLRTDYDGIVHIEFPVMGRAYPYNWSPMCEPNHDRVWSNSDAAPDAVPTCLWCVGERKTGRPYMVND
jgi:hypothetical protein